MPLSNTGGRVLWTWWICQSLQESLRLYSFQKLFPLPASLWNSHCNSSPLIYTVKPNHSLVISCTVRIPFSAVVFFFPFKDITMFNYTSKLHTYFKSIWEFHITYSSREREREQGEKEWSIKKIKKWSLLNGDISYTFQLTDDPWKRVLIPPLIFLSTKYSRLQIKVFNI